MIESIDSCYQSLVNYVPDSLAQEVNQRDQDELLDARPSRCQRTALKAIADFLAAHYDEHELMYLANALEDWAYKEREASK